MRRILLSFLLPIFLLQGSDISGRWDSPTEMKDQDGKAVVIHMLIKQEGAKISGGVWTEDHDADQPKPIQNGTIEGTRLRFEVPQRGDAVVAFDLEVSAEEIHGTAKFQGPAGAQEVKLAFHRADGRQ